MRMTSHQWFWALLASAAIWAIAGNRWDSDPDPTHRRWMQMAQNDVIGQVPRVMLLPAENILKVTEGLAISAIDRVTAPAETAVTMEELQEQLQNLRASNAYLNRQLKAANEQIISFSQLGPLAADCISANVVGLPSGPGTSLVHLDRGAAHHVAVGMPVVAPLEQVTALGRVVTVGQMDCEVMLFTDPRMKVTADIVRDNLAISPTNAPVVVEGMGGSEMRCLTLDVDRPAGADGPAPAPAKGDYVLLVDAHWPQALRFMPIGRIDEVRTREDQAKRYDLRIVPLRPISSIRTVMIVTRQ